MCVCVCGGGCWRNEHDVSGKGSENGRYALNTCIELCKNKFN